MSEHPDPEQLGAPDLKIQSFRLWVHRRLFPDSTNRFDGNVLFVTAHCGGIGASVFAQGDILMVDDFLAWGRACDALAEWQAKEAELRPYEHNLRVMARPTDSLGHYELRVSITPDYLVQDHVFRFEIDQTELREIARVCRKILAAYPIVGEDQQ